MVGKHKPVLIIIASTNMLLTTSENTSTLDVTKNVRELFYENMTKSQRQNRLIGIEAVKACQRPSGPPLLWFNSQYAHLSDTKEDIKEWMRGKNKKIAGRDLVTDGECVAGYEADIVIYLGQGNMSEYMSRCRGQFVHITV